MQGGVRLSKFHFLHSKRQLLIVVNNVTYYAFFEVNKQSFILKCNCICISVMGTYKVLNMTSVLVADCSEQSQHVLKFTSVHTAPVSEHCLSSK